MPGSKLDPIDRKILAELQADGRMTNVELASRVGISAPPCLRRVRTLEEQGYIRGYHAAVDARSVRPRPTSSPSKTGARVGRSSASATCLTAKWISS